MGIAKQVRCPICNKFGSRKLGGYCKEHKPDYTETEYIKKEMYYGYKFHEGPFISDEYGYKKYGYQRG